MSASIPALPFEIDDAGRPESEIEASESTDKPLARIGQAVVTDVQPLRSALQQLRLNHRHDGYMTVT